MFKQEAQLLLW